MLNLNPDWRSPCGPNRFLQGLITLTLPKFELRILPLTAPHTGWFHTFSNSVCKLKRRFSRMRTVLVMAMSWKNSCGLWINGLPDDVPATVLDERRGLYFAGSSPYA